MFCRISHGFPIQLWRFPIDGGFPPPKLLPRGVTSVENKNKSSGVHPWEVKVPIE